MSIDYTKYREDLFKSIAARKSYVTLTPYIRAGENDRIRANMFTTIDYSKEAVMARIDTDGAVSFIESIATAIEDDILSRGETPLWWSFDGELSFFVESRVRTVKNYRPNGLQPDDILDGVNCITISYPDLTSENAYHRKTFIVDLDDLGKKLNDLGYDTNIWNLGVTSKYAKEVAVTKGLDDTPKILITKNYYLAKAADKADKSLT